jgi:hypothetical protein
MASIGGAVRSLITGVGVAGVGDKVYRDIAPPETTTPYITIFDEISNQMTLAGDSEVIARIRLVQVSLWQSRQAENVELIDDLVALLDNALLEANQHVLGCRVSEIQRLFDAESDTIQHAITLRVHQKA